MTLQYADMHRLVWLAWRCNPLVLMDTLNRSHVCVVGSRRTAVVLAGADVLVRASAGKDWPRSHGWSVRPNNLLRAYGRRRSSRLCQSVCYAHARSWSQPETGHIGQCWDTHGQVLIADAEHILIRFGALTINHAKTCSSWSTVIWQWKMTRYLMQSTLVELDPTSRKLWPLAMATQTWLISAAQSRSDGPVGISFFLPSPCSHLPVAWPAIAGSDDFAVGCSTVGWAWKTPKLRLPVAWPNLGDPPWICEGAITKRKEMGRQIKDNTSIAFQVSMARTI